MKKVGFEALIKEIKTKSLVSGDKATWVILQLQDKAVKDEILNLLNKLHRADQNVAVVITEIEK